MSAICVDGKTLRGSRNTLNRQPHILSASAHGSGIMLKDKLVSAKKSEVQFIMPLLDEVDIAGKCVTADALHTIKGFCQHLEERKAFYVMIVKGNKKKLVDRLKMLDIRNNFDEVFETTDIGHGRIEKRRL